MSEMTLNPTPATVPGQQLQFKIFRALTMEQCCTQAGTCCHCCCGDSGSSGVSNGGGGCYCGWFTAVIDCPSQFLGWVLWMALMWLSMCPRMWMGQIRKLWSGTSKYSMKVAPLPIVRTVTQLLNSYVWNKRNCNLKKKSANNDAPLVPWCHCAPRQWPNFITQAT